MGWGDALTEVSWKKKKATWKDTTPGMAYTHYRWKATGVLGKLGELRSSLAPHLATAQAFAREHSSSMGMVGAKRKGRKYQDDDFMLRI